MIMISDMIQIKIEASLFNKNVGYLAYVHSNIFCNEPQSSICRDQAVCGYG